MNETAPLVDLFRKKAELVSAVVTEISTADEAIAYTVDLCEKKEACRLLVSGCEAPLSPKADELCETKAQGKVMAATALEPDLFDSLSEKCREKGIMLLKQGLREHLAGIDIGFTEADYGIAETGTLVINSCSEDLRLSTMISEIHIALLPVAKIRERAEDIEAELLQWMIDPPNYTAFITGASRTADIERVLALGVHGPLELHILLLKE